MAQQSRQRRLGSLIGLFIAVVLAVLVYTQRQAIYDYARLYNYQPPSDIAALVTATAMTDKSEHIFYVNRPQLQDRQAFNQSCPDNGGEQTIVLGCYQSPQAGIYLFKVTDPQLNGVQEVTAAHEMLHGAYDRLDRKERARVDAMLQNFYAQLQDERLKTIFEAYQKSEPNDIPNEMHSILGTEVANLSPELESYYQQYFTNRQKVVALANQYQSAFSSRKAAIASYDAQLESLKAQIELAQAGLENQSQAINSQRQQMNSLRSSGNIDAYNQMVDSFNARVQSYNAGLALLKNQISQYNDIVEKRNALAVETQDLAQHLNSRLPDMSTQ